MRHVLKIAPEFYEAVLTGIKTFEIRRNDRNFKIDDSIVLREYFDGKYTDRFPLAAHITYITNYAQQEGYVVFSFSGIVPLITWKEEYA